MKQKATQTTQLPRRQNSRALSVIHQKPQNQQSEHPRAHGHLNLVIPHPGLAWDHQPQPDSPTAVPATGRHQGSHPCSPPAANPARSDLQAVPSSCLSVKNRNFAIKLTCMCFIQAQLQIVSPSLFEPVATAVHCAHFPLFLWKGGEERRLFACFWGLYTKRVFTNHNAKSKPYCCFEDRIVLGTLTNSSWPAESCLPWKHIEIWNPTVDLHKKRSKRKK